MDLQGKLLKVLVENSITRLGGNQKINVNLRFISGTNPDLLHKKIADKNKFD